MLYVLLYIDVLHDVLGQCAMYQASVCHVPEMLYAKALLWLRLQQNEPSSKLLVNNVAFLI